MANYVSGLDYENFGTAAQLNWTCLEACRVEMSHANVTAQGRLIARRIGVDPATNYPFTKASTWSSMLVGGWWKSPRGENGNIREPSGGMTGSVVLSDDGTAYTTFTGDSVRRRTVVLGNMPAVEVMSLSPGWPISEDTYTDDSWQTIMQEWLDRGELVRYWADSTATRRYITAAVTITSTTITFDSNTGISANVPLCVNGEWILPLSISAGTTWNVRRRKPAAHAKYAPASPAFVATYALDDDGGNINRGGFSPSVRALANIRYDMEIALVRATP